MKDVILFGTGDMAQVVTYYLDRFAEFNVVGFTLDRAYIQGDSYEGRPLVPWDELEQHYPPSEFALFGPMTYKKMNTVRRDRYLEGKKRGYDFASFIHPASHIYSEDIGENCLILEGNTVQPFAKIGHNNIIWSNNHIAHHVVIGDHCFIASQVAVAGSAVIGDECYLAGQVGISHGLTIGKACAVLNGVHVHKDLEDDSVVVGPPAKLKPFPSSKLHHLL